MSSTRVVSSHWNFLVGLSAVDEAPQTSSETLLSLEIGVSKTPLTALLSTLKNYLKAVENSSNLSPRL